VTPLSQLTPKPTASSLLPLRATFWLPGFFPQPGVSGFYRKTAGIGWEGREGFSVGRYEGKSLHGTKRGLASRLPSGLGTREHP